MIYKIYAYSYEFGWELNSIVSKQENILNTINNLSPYDYGQYMVIQKKKDRDEIYDSGVIARPHTMKLKNKKK